MSNTEIDIDKEFEKAFDAEFKLREIYAVLGKDFVLALVENTKKARKKYPVFATCEEEKLKLLQEEFEEVCEAFYVPQDEISSEALLDSQDEIKQVFYTSLMERLKEELLDVGTVLARWYNGE